MQQSARVRPGPDALMRRLPANSAYIQRFRLTMQTATCPAMYNATSTNVSATPLLEASNAGASSSSSAGRRFVIAGRVLGPDAILWPTRGCGSQPKGGEPSVLLVLRPTAPPCGSSDILA